MGRNGILVSKFISPIKELQQARQKLTADNPSAATLVAHLLQLKGSTLQQRSTPPPCCWLKAETEASKADLLTVPALFGIHGIL